MQKAVLYARYSSDNQRGESIDAQLRASREYCKKKEYIIVGEYIDEAFTATNDNRPAYQRMMEDSKRKIFDVVVFHKIDRSARNEYDYYFNKFKLQKFNVRIEFSAQNIDDSPEGALMENQLVGFAAYFSRNLSKEVKKGKKENALKGLFNGGKPPFGYNVVDKQYIIDDFEAEGVRLIFDMYLKGYGYIAIADELNARGYKTKRGCKFGKNSLHEILRNARYIGTYILGKTQKDINGKRNAHADITKDTIVVENAVPAIIDKNTFAKVAEKMENNKRRRAAYGAKYTYLLSGLVYCGECGTAMQGKTTTKHHPERIYQYYYCGNQSRKGKTACSNRLIDLASLEDLVISKLEETLFNPTAKKILLDKISTAYEKRTNTFNIEYENLLKQKNKTSRRMDMLYTQIEEGLADEYDIARLKKVKDEMTAIRSKIAELEARPKASLSPEQVQAVLDSFESAIKTKSADNLRALIENFINKITVSKDEIVIEFKINNSFCTNGAVDGT